MHSAMLTHDSDHALCHIDSSFVAVFIRMNIWVFKMLPVNSFM